MKPRSVATFWSRVDKRGDGDCWPWRGYRSPLGYGRFSATFNGGPRLAHRLMWEMANGSPVPDGMSVCHRCDNPSCVNPGHLFLGTHQDNVADMVAKGRGKLPPTRTWPDNHAAKLNPDKVREIRAAWASEGRDQRAIARRFGIGQRTLCQIIKRETWKHVTAALLGLLLSAPAQANATADYLANVCWLEGGWSQLECSAVSHVLKRRAARAGLSVAEMAVRYTPIDSDRPRAVRARAMPRGLSAHELPKWRALVRVADGVLSGTVSNPCPRSSHWGSPDPRLTDRVRAERAIAAGRWRRVRCQGRLANSYFAEVGR